MSARADRGVGEERRVPGAEALRLKEEETRQKDWKRFGPYLSERQWGTVREDYSEGGECWQSFSHDHARSRAYRWGEDGLLGFSDRQARLCFALALWNGRDPILKERLFGLTNPEGNHGEDVKECYYYLDATPTYSYAKALYKYPQGEFPYARLVEENQRRGPGAPEYELAHTGAFDDGRYFDVTAEYAKAGPSDLLVRVMVANRGPEAAALHVLPTLWFRNTWAWGRQGESYPGRPALRQLGPDAVRAEHPALGTMVLRFDRPAGSAALLFTDNETNMARLFGVASQSSHFKDAFHELVVGGRRGAVRGDGMGTKCAVHHELLVPAGSEVVLRLRLTALTGDEEPSGGDLGADFDLTFSRRIEEADEFYAGRLSPPATREERAVARQAYAGLLWSKQFYHYIVEHWREGDPAQPEPPAGHRDGRNREWGHVHCRDVLSMPDKWEYPWFAAWDLAFHMVPFAKIDPSFAKQQLLLLLREWYMHPNGQIPAYEYAFGDVNPPVHAWAAWRVYKIAAPRGQRDLDFLKRVFHKLMLNFTWWVNRKDDDGNNLFSGGFLGLDNIGIFDRSQPLPTGGRIEQADGTAWMAFYASTMLAMALEIASHDQSYEDVASKFFEHFVAIVDAMNGFGHSGLWDETDGFYYDHLHVGGCAGRSMRTRSMVGIIPLFAVEVLESAVLDALPGFKKRMEWFVTNRRDLARHIAYLEPSGGAGHPHRLLAIPSRDRLIRVLRYILDENEFLATHGVRALSRVHKDYPYTLEAQGREYRIEYVPGDSTSGLFGGNSNWRGPIWFPLNYLLVESLQRYHHFYGDDFRVECPTGSGQWMHLGEVAIELARRLSSLFLPDAEGRRPCHGDDVRYARDPRWKELVHFYEYFHGDTGCGLGASHQTGWTALVVRCLEEVAAARGGAESRDRGASSVPPHGGHHDPGA